MNAQASAVSRGLPLPSLISPQADVRVCLALITLGCLRLNAALHAWRANPVGALARSPVIAQEEVEAVPGKTGCEVDSWLVKPGALDART